MLETSNGKSSSRRDPLDDSVILVFSTITQQPCYIPCCICIYPLNFLPGSILNETVKSEELPTVGVNPVDKIYQRIKRVDVAKS